MDRAKFRAWLLEHEANEHVGIIRSSTSCPLANWRKSFVILQSDGSWPDRFAELVDDLVTPVQIDGSMPVTSAQALAILDSIK